MTHWGGTGRYVEGERVFAPPTGSFDADWVAGIVQDRLGPLAGNRAAVTAAATAVWEVRCEGGDHTRQVAAAAAAHAGGGTAEEIVSAVADYLDAYGV